MTVTAKYIQMLNVMFYLVEIKSILSFVLYAILYNLLNINSVAHTRVKIIFIIWRISILCRDFYKYTRKYNCDVVSGECDSTSEEGK